MTIVTIRHRHSYPFPAGYVCSVHRDELAQIIHALFPESCPVIASSFKGTVWSWELLFSTPPIEPRELIVIGDTLDALVAKYRKPELTYGTSTTARYYHPA